jgi:hypothetical protein
MKRLFFVTLILAASLVRAEEPPLASFDALTSRPLFTPGRHSAAPAARLNAASLRLTGIVTDQDRSVALVRSDEMKSEVRISAGATLNGWQVSAITSKGLDLAASGQHRHVGLKQVVPLVEEIAPNK